MEKHLSVKQREETEQTEDPSHKEEEDTVSESLDLQFE
jgi:hypothetical protein